MCGPEKSTVARDAAPCHNWLYQELIPEPSEQAVNVVTRNSLIS